MSAFGGPNIIDDGLVLYLDAGNRKSYPGSGTAWFDKSGRGNNGTLTNGPTFNTGSLGSIVFDGTNDYVDCGVLGNYGSEMATKGITFDFAFRSTYTAAFKQFGTINTGANTLLVINFNRDENDLYVAGKTSFALRANGGSYLVGAISTNIYTGNIFIVSITRQPNTNQITFYINGIQQTTFYDLYTATPNVFSNFEYFFTIGAVNNRGTVVVNLDCSIPYFKIYNRALSASEVLQNYNATKGRFNL
jgi:hypothetical protein